jgi:DNA polymerase-3 subunit alpha
MLGLYVSDHPLSGLGEMLSRESDTSIAALVADEERPEGDVVKIAGLVTGLNRRIAKNSGEYWASLQLEDLDGAAVEVNFFPKVYKQFGEMLAEDQVIAVRGRLRRRDDQASIFAMEMFLPDATQTVGAPLQVTVEPGKCDEVTLGRLREILAAHPGSSDVHLHIIESGRKTIVKAAGGLKVERSAALFGHLKAVLGSNCLG